VDLILGAEQSTVGYTWTTNHNKAAVRVFDQSAYHSICRPSVPQWLSLVATSSHLLTDCCCRVTCIKMYRSRLNEATYL